MLKSRQVKMHYLFKPRIKQLMRDVVANTCCGFFIKPIKQPAVYTALILTILLSALNVAQTGWAETTDTDNTIHVDSNIELSHQVYNMAYGELLFHYFQNQTLESLTLILAENQDLGFQEHQDHSNILQGALYLSLGMTEHAEQIFSETAKTALNPQTRNKAWLALAELAYNQKNYPKAKAILLNKFEIESESENDTKQKNQARQYLGLIYLREGQYIKAIEQLETINNDPLKQRYASYNLALAFFARKENDTALILLQSLLKLPTYNAEEDAIRDKAALALGQYYLEQNKPYLSNQAFSEVRLNGAFANDALLGLGWANLKRAETSKALAPWLELLDRNPSQKNVLDAFLMTPRAYEQLNAYQDAFSAYLTAGRVYEAEINHIKNTLKYINQNNWLEQLRPDNILSNTNASLAFLNTLATPINGPEAAYLYQLFSTNSFNAGFQSFWELQLLEIHLNKWQRKLPVFNLLLENQVIKNNTLNKQLNSRLAGIDINHFARQIESLNKQTSITLTQENFYAPGNDAEQDTLNRLIKLETMIAELPNTEEFDGIRSRYRIVRGTFFWNLKYNSYRRVYNAKKQLQSARDELSRLDENIDKLKTGETKLINKHSQHQRRINTLEIKITELIENIRIQKHKQQKELQSLANRLLNARLTHAGNLLARTQIAIARLQDKAASDGGQVQ